MRYLFLFLFTFPAMAVPICNMQTKGTLECMTGVMCECIFKTPGTMTNDPGGYRWDCGIKRPACLEYKKIEADNSYDGPQAVGIDKSTETTIIDNTNDNINTNNP